jgi:hypothetical protein
MNCEKCQELLSDFLDGALTGEDHAFLNTHFEECLPCADMRQDLHAIMSVAHESREQYVSPPNERALWLRVRNTIESELNDNRAAAITSRLSAGQRESFWSHLINKRWELSLPQLTAAITAIVVVVSLATALSLQTIRSGISPDTTLSSNGTGVNNGLSGRVNSQTQFNPNDYIRQNQLDIEFWKQRVEQRKAHWSPRMREAFERNMDVIDQALNDSLNELGQSPHDDVSEEMLNAALRNKIELLKEFSDL